MSKEDTAPGRIPGLGQRLYRARQAASTPKNNITQVRAGETVGRSGVTVGRWEKDEDVPSVWDLIGLAKLYNCDVAELAYGTKEDRELYRQIYMPMKMQTEMKAAALAEAQVTLEVGGGLSPPRPEDSPEGT